MGTGEFPEENTYALRSVIDKWDLIKLQRFCEAKDTVNRIKRQSTDWKKINTYTTSDRVLISKKLDFRESNKAIKN